MDKTELKNLVLCKLTKLIAEALLITISKPPNSVAAFSTAAKIHFRNRWLLQQGKIH